MAQQARVLDREVRKRVHLEYLLYTPGQYTENTERLWPLILFLHGAGERGSDLEMVKKHGIPKIAEARDDLPFIAVSPQCPEGTTWSEEMLALEALLDKVQEAYAVDPKRVYLTGLSMGGFGSWHLGALRPERFAAVVPICGGGDWFFRRIQRVCTLAPVPVWAFHGAKDPVVPVERSVEMVEALRACGGNARLTIYPDADHDAWTRTYEDESLYDWLLQQSR